MTVIFLLMTVAIISFMIAIAYDSPAVATISCVALFLLFGAGYIAHESHSKNAAYCGTTDYIVESGTSYRLHPETNTYITCMQWRKEYVTMPSLPE